MNTKFNGLRRLMFAGLAGIGLASVALPAQAAPSAVTVALQGRNDRYERSRDRDNRNDYRIYRQGVDRDDWGRRKEAMARRAAAIRDRVTDLHRRDRLSRQHRDRVLEKLDRIRDDVRSRDRIDDQRMRANDRYLDGIERDIDNWSRSDTRLERRRR